MNKRQLKAWLRNDGPALASEIALWAFVAGLTLVTGLQAAM